MCSRYSNNPYIILCAAITGTIFLLLILTYGPLDVIFVLVPLGVVLYSIVFFVREDKRLQGALATVFSKMCICTSFSGTCNREKRQGYDVQSENCHGRDEGEEEFEEHVCKDKQKFTNYVKDLDRTCYIDIDKALEKRSRQCCRSTSVCQNFDSDIGDIGKNTVRELSLLSVEGLKYAKYDCCSSCDTTCTFRQKRLEIYKLIQTLIDLDHQCSCPESVQFLKDLKQFATRNFENQTTMQWWDDYQTLKIPPSCCNLNWYMTLQRTGRYGVVCSMHRNPNCPQEKEPLVINCDHENPCDAVGTDKQKPQKTKKSKKGIRRFNWFTSRMPKKKKSTTP